MLLLLQVSLQMYLSELHDPGQKLQFGGSPKLHGIT